MNNEGLNGASTVIEDPTQKYEAPPRVNVDVLKQRWSNKKEKIELREQLFYLQLLYL